MRKRLLLILALAALAVGLALWVRQRQTAARRMAAWREQQLELGLSDKFEQLVKFEDGQVPLADFARLIERKSGLTVEIDPAVWAQIEARRQQNPTVQVGDTVSLWKARMSLRTALRNALEPVGLSAQLRGERIWITKRDQTPQDDRRLTVVYPLPQPEPAAMDAAAWRETLAGYASGPGRHIEPVPGALIVVTSPDDHRRIRLVMDAICNLREARPRPVLLPPPPLGDMEQRILNELDKVMSIPMEFVETPLVDAVAYLSDQHNIPIILCLPQLKDAGVNADAPVTKNLRGISLRSALRLLLKELDLTFIVRDDALFITTPDDAESQLRDIAYPVHDLIEPAGEAGLAALQKIITEVIAPQSWDQVGGPGTLRAVNNQWLLASQTSEIHEQLAELLGNLRQALADDFPQGGSLPAALPVEARIRAALAKPSFPVDFRQAPLKDVVAFLQDSFGIPMVLNAKTLNDAGVNIDAPITAQFPAVSVEFLLELLLKPLDLTYVIRDEVLQVTTPDDAESQLQTGLFNIRPLLGTRFTPDSLGGLIRELASRRSWNTVGGPGQIEHFRGLLVVSQTSQNLDEIGKLLAALRQHCVLQQPPLAPGTGVPLVVTSARQHIAEQLLQPADIKLPALPLAEALRHLGNAQGVSIVLDWKAPLDTAAAPQSMSPPVAETSLAAAMDKMLAPQQWGWMIRDRVIYVTSFPGLETRSEICFYQVKAPAAQLRDRLQQPLPGDDWTIEGAYAVEPDWLLIRASQPSHRKIETWLEQQRQPK